MNQTSKSIREEKGIMKKIKVQTMGCVLLVSMIFFALLMSMSVRADSNNEFVANGKNYTLKSTTKYSYMRGQRINAGEVYELYVNDNYGQEKVAEIETTGSLSYVSSYKDKLLFNWDDGAGGVKVYSYTVGEAGFALLKNKLKIEYIEGKYAIGETVRATDVSASKLGILNLNTGKKTNLGAGYSPVIMKGKLYYAKMNSKQTVMKIVRCKMNGKKQKVLKTIKSKDMICGVNIKKGYVTYYTSKKFSSFSNEKKAKFKM